MLTKSEKELRIQEAIKRLQGGASPTEACRLGNGMNSKWLEEFPELKKQFDEIINKKQKKSHRDKQTGEGRDKIIIRCMGKVYSFLGSAGEINTPLMADKVKMLAPAFFTAIEKNDIAFFGRFNLKPADAAKFIATYKPVIQADIKGDELEDKIAALAREVVKLIETAKKLEEEAGRPKNQVTRLEEILSRTGQKSPGVQK